MEKAICWQCFEDKYLKEIVKNEGEQLECSACGEERTAFTVERLGERIEPIMREHFRQGDQDYGEQRGDPLSFCVQEVVGECFGLEDDIVEAVVATEHVDPSDGDVPFFDDTCNYVGSPVSLHGYYAQWDFVVQELKYRRRFFSPSAKALFDSLFDGVETMQAWSDEGKSHESVVRELPKGSELFRARICDSQSLLKDILTDPFKHVGPTARIESTSGPDERRWGRHFLWCY